MAGFFSQLISYLQLGLEFLGTIFQHTAFQVLCRYCFQFLLPVFAVLIVVRCGRSMLQARPEQELWGSLVLPDGEQLPLCHWENLVGRAKRCDVVLPYATVSRSHAALIRDDRGRWMLHPLNAKNGVTLNGIPVTDSVQLAPQDRIGFGGVEARFLPLTEEEERRQMERRTRPGRFLSPSVTLLLLTLVQGMLLGSLCMALPDSSTTILTCFGLLMGMEWLLYVIYRAARRTGFELETLAFFLTSLCLTVTAVSSISTLYRQTICVALGLAVFFVMNLILRDLDLAKGVRWPLAIGSVALLIFNVLFGEQLFGAKNWVAIGPISFQPSELVKIVFILVGAATLDRLFDRKNLLGSLLFSVFCVGCLVLMSDFGTALIFFVAFLAIAFLRSGDLASVIFMVAAAGTGGMLVLHYRSYIAQRFAIYRHVWEDTANLGYQQTRTMSAIASGGLFGRGVGNGWLKSLGAANTDLVFGVVSEELGLIVAVCAVVSIVLMALFAIRQTAAARSSFYVIGACATSMLLLVQTMLNVFGSVDLLPLTGVTFPFASVGGSSMISCWGLLAFLKAADTRQNASLAIRLPGKRRRAAQAAAPQRWEPPQPPAGQAPAAASGQEETKIMSRASAEEETVVRRPEPPRREDAPATLDEDEPTLLQRKEPTALPASPPEQDFDAPPYADDDVPLHSDADDWQKYFQWEEDDP
ncbi:MAG: FtsW/RodA/SpoVE family cell cycle protein [Clostridiales bacterium]|nr:FtsW/RodA/SpoVE family cell cycle protein [Clostridiales bacterium]